MVLLSAPGISGHRKAAFNRSLKTKADITRDCLVPSSRISFRSHPHSGEAIVNTYP